jgi:hypothetical protein
VKKDLAAAANVLAVVSFCTMGFTAIVGLMVGVFAIVRAKRHPERQRMDRAVASVAANLLIVILMAGHPGAAEAKATLGTLAAGK